MTGRGPHGAVRLVEVEGLFSSPSLSLAAGKSLCEVAPLAGGSIFSWTVNGQDMLRASSGPTAASSDPLTLASFPLVPFSNRIAFGQFEWAGEKIRIEPNFPPEPHAVHGTGWQRPWKVAEQCQDSCTLFYVHDANADWPWSFSAIQKLTVTSDSLRLELAATNIGDQPAPLAFGHHPYFDSDGATLQFHAGSVLLSDDQSLPTVPTAPVGDHDFRAAVDHCYTGWDGTCEIEWDGRPMKLQIRSDMKAAVVFIPKDGLSFCFEPVPHINNALNRTDGPGLSPVAPGDTWRSFIHMCATPA
jgi:aldose 1-epimerase